MKKEDYYGQKNMLIVLAVNYYILNLKLQVKLATG